MMQAATIAQSSIRPCFRPLVRLVRRGSIGGTEGRGSRGKEESGRNDGRAGRSARRRRGMYEVCIYICRCNRQLITSLLASVPGIEARATGRHYTARRDAVCNLFNERRGCASITDVKNALANHARTKNFREPLGREKTTPKASNDDACPRREGRGVRGNRNG